MANDPKNSELEPEVDAFAKWFADWWLRRGSRLYTAAKKADPARFKNPKASDKKGLPLRWDKETERIVLDRDRELDGAADSSRRRRGSDDSTT